jgi:hypothetical protein
MPKPTETTSAKDWPEDASHENGNYFNMCSVCDEQFIGHKRRMICKQCSTRAAERKAGNYV